MDYTNFVKNFYRYSLTELNKYKNYYGRLVQISKPLDIPSEFLHAEEKTNMFLPAFSLNIDAPVKYFIDFMNYYIALMPDLNIVFANESRIKDLYERVVNMNILEDDSNVMRFIELVVGIGIKVLEQQGILEK